MDSTVTQTGTRTDEDLIRVEGLKTHFPLKGGFLSRARSVVKAVDDVSFTVKRGQVLGLVGESGSGKTTIGRTMLRLIDPTGGHIWYQGADLAALPPRQMRPYRRTMQIVFQDPFSSLNPRMTVGQIIAEGLDIHGLESGSGRRDRVGQLLREVGLRPEHATRYPHEFSGGQRQRIGIARALAVRPSFLVADEPVSALDVSIQAQVLNLLQDLRDNYDLSMMMISHDLGVVRHSCDYVVVLYLGRIMEMAPARTLYRMPKHPYTESLLSAMPVPNPRAKRSQSRTILQGDIPSPINPPSGCVFRTRCPIATAECAKLVPPLEETGNGHFKACIHR